MGWTAGKRRLFTAHTDSGRRVTSADRCTRRLAVIKPEEGWESRRGMRLKRASHTLDLALSMCVNFKNRMAAQELRSGGV